MYREFIDCQYDFIASYSHAARCCSCLEVKRPRCSAFMPLPTLILEPIQVPNFQVLSECRRSMRCEEFRLGVGFGDTVWKRKLEVFGK